MGLGGKKTDIAAGWITVVAGALPRDDGRWLMHRRPVGKHHAGLWEFPGGKVEPDEMPTESLIRELGEELGIACRADACVPIVFAESTAETEGHAIVILLYKVTDWDCTPEALEGGAVDWFTPQEVLALAKPPLDISLAQGLFQNH